MHDEIRWELVSGPFAARRTSEQLRAAPDTTSTLRTWCGASEATQTTLSTFSTLRLDGAALKCLSTLYPVLKDLSLDLAIDALILVVVLILTNALLDAQPPAQTLVRSA